MNKVTIGICIALTALVTGCSTADPNGTSYNFSLVRLTLNAALYKSSASSAEAGESVTQDTVIDAQGAETLDVPLAGLMSVTPSSTGDGTVITNGAARSINLVPLRGNLSIWKSSSQDATAGASVQQRTQTDTGGDSGLSISAQDE